MTIITGKVFKEHPCHAILNHEVLSGICSGTAAGLQGGGHSATADSLCERSWEPTQQHRQRSPAPLRGRGRGNYFLRIRSQDGMT